MAMKIELPYEAVSAIEGLLAMGYSREEIERYATSGVALNNFKATVELHRLTNHATSEEIITAFKLGFVEKPEKRIQYMRAVNEVLQNDELSDDYKTAYEQAFRDFKRIYHG